MTTEAMVKLIVAFYTNPAQHAENLITSLKDSPMALINILKEHPSLVPHLMHKKLNVFWNHFRIHLEPTPDVDFHFNQQHQLTDAELCIGYLYFALSRNKLEKDEDKQIDYCLSAVNYHSFHAIKYIILQLITSIKEKGFYEIQPKLALFLNQHQNTLAIHNTPGYILLAYSYFMLSNACDPKEQLAVKTIALQESIKFCITAEKLLEFSDDDIHNAYFGKGLVLGTHFKISSLESLKTHLLTHATNILSRDELSSAMEQGKRLASQKLPKKKHPTTLSQEADSTLKDTLLQEDKRNMDQASP